MKKNHFSKIVMGLLLLGNYSASFAQEGKSFYFKKNVVLCPVDITKLYTKDGFIKGNITLDTVKSIVVKKERVLVSDPITKENKETEQIQSVVKIDTVFNYAIIMGADKAFNVIKEVGTFTIIKFWTIHSKDKGLLESLLQQSSDGKMLDAEEIAKKKIIVDRLSGNFEGSTPKVDLSKDYYLIKTSDLKNEQVEFVDKKNLWSVGILAMPIKIRPFATESGQFDFIDGFSVGTTFSLTTKHNWRTSLTNNLLLYVGVSSFTADSTKIKEVRNDYKIAAFSPGVGWMWERNGVQLSFLIGIDFPAGNLQKKWVYRNQPWIGLGLGIGLFRFKNDEDNKAGSNK